MEYVYAALLLHKLGQEVNEDNLKKVVSSTGVEVDESKVKIMLASLKGVDIAAELENASVMAAAPSSTGSPAEGEEKVEEKPKEEKKEAAAEGLSALFG
jgi:large subunit ribosomal protein L12